MPGARAVAIALLLATLLAIPGASAAGPDPRQRVLELTNAERVRAGLEPLAWSPELAEAADGYVRLLAESGCFGHACGGTGLAERAEASGFHGWTALGENLAGGQDTPEEAVAAWMNSPGHRDNLLNPRYREIGIGFVQGGYYRFYWAQVFGARQEEPTRVDRPASDVETAPEAEANPAPAEVAAAEVEAADEASDEPEQAAAEWDAGGEPAEASAEPAWPWDPSVLVE